MAFNRYRTLRKMFLGTAAHGIYMLERMKKDRPLNTKDEIRTAMRLGLMQRVVAAHQVTP